MNKDQLKTICENLLPKIQLVGDFIETQLGKISEGAIEHKSLNSLVSHVDKEAEEQLVLALKEALPSSGFLTEEGTVSQSDSTEMRWIIDPLDGTTNFLHQIPFFSISVALEYKGRIVLGIILECLRKECFYGWEGGAAMLNGSVINTSQTELLKDSLLATGFPYYYFENIDKYMKTLSSFMEGTRGIRRLGSAALDLAYVACGRFDGFYETNLNPWDVAAGVFLVELAGGKTSDFSGTGTAVNGREILAGNPSVYIEMKKVINAAGWKA